MPAPTPQLRIVSGGQTGVDLAALDAAIACSLPHGGWAPHGNYNEAGSIPKTYQLMPLAEGGGYGQRTRKNVEDSDGTLIVYRNELVGGTLKTANICLQERKPLLKINLARRQIDDFPSLISGFITANRILVLNIAGPRASGDPEIYQDTFRLLLQTFRNI